MEMSTQFDDAPFQQANSIGRYTLPNTVLNHPLYAKYCWKRMGKSNTNTYFHKFRNSFELSYSNTLLSQLLLIKLLRTCYHKIHAYRIIIFSCSSRCITCISIILFYHYFIIEIIEIIEILLLLFYYSFCSFFLVVWCAS